MRATTKSHTDEQLFALMSRARKEVKIWDSILFKSERVLPDGTRIPSGNSWRTRFRLDFDDTNCALDLYEAGVPVDWILKQDFTLPISEIVAKLDDKKLLEKEEVKRLALMTRENMIGRLIKIKQEHGEISNKTIADDPLLDLYILQREFGGIGKIRKIVKTEMRRQGLLPSNGEEYPEEGPKIAEFEHSEASTKREICANAEDFKKLMKAAAKEKQNTPRVEAKPKEKAEAFEVKTEKEKDGDHQMKKSKGIVQFTHEDVYEKVLALAKDIGKIPSGARLSEQSKSHPDFPSPMTVKKHLGDGWQQKMADELGFNKKLPKKSAPKKTTKRSAPKKPAKQPTASKTTSKLVAKKPTKKVTKISEAPKVTPNKALSKATLERTISSDWIAELNSEYGIKMDKIVKSHKEAATLVTEALEAIASTADAFSEFDASKLLQYDMEGGGTTLIYILASK